MNDRRRFRRLSLAAALPLAFAALSVLAAPMALAPGDKAPSLAGQILGSGRSFVDYTAHEVTLVNFWATWCEPCQQEMPALEEVWKRRADDGLYIVGVVKQYIDPTELEDFIDAVGVTYPILMPRAKMTKDWGGVGTLPLSFLVDREGKILRRYLGATEEQVKGLIYDLEAALDGKPLGPVIIPEDPNYVTEEDRPRKTRWD